MSIFHYEYKVKPESGYHTALRIGFAHVYIKADNLIEGRLRAQVVLEESHFIVLERMYDGEEYDAQLHDPHPEALKFIELAKKDGVAIYVGGVGSVPAESEVHLRLKAPKTNL
jgi:hypothetical protein